MLEDLISERKCAQANLKETDFFERAVIVGRYHALKVGYLSTWHFTASPSAQFIQISANQFMVLLGQNFFAYQPCRV